MNYYIVAFTDKLIFRVRSNNLDKLLITKLKGFINQNDMNHILSDVRISVKLIPKMNLSTYK